MRQIWIPKTGEPEVLELREAPDPEPLAGEVRVRVQSREERAAEAAQDAAKPIDDDVENQCHTRRGLPVHVSPRRICQPQNPPRY